MPRLHLTFSSAPQLSFQRVGRNHATTFHGMCNAHDTEYFSPVETADIDHSNENHLFLLSYRAVLKEVHATAKTAIDTQSAYRAGVERGLYPGDVPSAPGMLAVEHMMLAYMTHMHKLTYDAALVSQNWGVLRHTVLDVGAPPSLVANSLFSTGGWSEETDSITYATLNVYPSQGNTWAVLSYLAEHESAALAFLQPVIGAESLPSALSKLVLKKCENFALKPSLYESFPAEKRRVCEEYFVRNMGGEEFEPHDTSMLSLFQ
ncbi:MAG: hypothetical protein JNM58_02925 [Xanthomonadaceae bacterium]|nr:hypothetical protein [Xanthomonadaceae bacterium]